MNILLLFTTKVTAVRSEVPAVSRLSFVSSLGLRLAFLNKHTWFVVLRGPPVKFKSYPCCSSLDLTRGNAQIFNP